MRNFSGRFSTIAMREAVRPSLSFGKEVRLLLHASELFEVSDESIGEALSDGGEKIEETEDWTDETTEETSNE